MTRAKNPSSPSRLILPLGGLLLATALMICWLVLVPHSTVVEMSLRVKRFEFIAVPEPSSASAVDRSFKLFESPVKLRYLSLKGVEGVAATLEGQGRAELRPENDASDASRASPSCATRPCRGAGDRLRRPCSRRPRSRSA